MVNQKKFVDPNENFQYHCIINVADQTKETTSTKNKMNTKTTTIISTTTKTTTSSIREKSTTSTTTTLQTTTSQTKTTKKLTTLPISAKFIESETCGISNSLSIGAISEYLVRPNVEKSDHEILVEIPHTLTSIVVNGNDVEKLGRYPWLVALRTKSGHHYCGGAVLNDNFVLTAAHCHFHVRYDRIVTGTVYRDHKKSDTVAKFYGGKKVFNHPGARATQMGTWTFDFQIIQTIEKIQFGDYLTPICLPEEGKKFIGSECWLAGWGRIEASPKMYADVLQESKATGNLFQFIT